MKLIDGKMTAAAIKEEIKAEVDQMIAAGLKRPHLAAVLVGHDGGSEAYVKNKVIACEKCGFKSSLIRMEAEATEEELLACIKLLNEDADVDGFIVQLPLPKHINEQKVINAIDYRKDVDGIHPMNAGRMTLGLPSFISATPLGIVTLLQRYTHGAAHAPEESRRLDSYRVPQPLDDLEGGVPRGRHHHRCHRPS